MHRRGWFVLLFLLAFCVVGFLVLKQVEHPFVTQLKYKDYVSIVTSLASLFVALVFILEYCHIQKPDTHGKQLPFADANRDYAYELEKRFSNDPDLYGLYSEFHSNHPELQEAVRRKEYQKIKEIQTVSLFLSQIENMLIHQAGTEHPRREQQLRVWKRYFQSPSVRHHYPFLKENLAPETSQFIDAYLV